MGAPGLAFETWEARRHKLPFKSKSGKPKPFLNESGLYNYAVKALGRSMRTEAELRRLMKSRVEPGDRGEAVIAAVVVRLKEQRYLDDRSFAETYTRLRQQNEKLGSLGVRRKLAQKGVPSQIANDAVDARYSGTDEEALARKHLEKKRIKKPENEKETARVMRRLVGAGFSAGVIYKILRHWDVPDEALSALENLDQDTPSED